MGGSPSPTASTPLGVGTSNTDTALNPSGMGLNPALPSATLRQAPFLGSTGFLGTNPSTAPTDPTTSAVLANMLGGSGPPTESAGAAANPNPFQLAPSQINPVTMSGNQVSPLASNPIQAILSVLQGGGK